MGGDNARIEFASKPPTVIMLCGLQGSGKTTHAAKLALMLKIKITDLCSLPAIYTDLQLLTS